MALSGSFHKYPTSKFGLYCDWTGSQSATGNYTDVTLNVYLQFYTLQVGSRTDSTISINGESETYTAPAINDTSSTSWHMVHLKSKTVRVYHNSNGTKTGMSLSASWRFSGSYGGVSIGTIIASATVDLNTIDRSAPTVSFSTSNVTANGFKISASSSAAADNWQYSLNGGASWTTFSSNASTSASAALSSLSPNTSYTVKVRARRKYNHVYGTSGSATVKTLGGAVLNSVSTVTADNATVTITVNATVYEASYSNSLAIKNGGTTILTVTGLSWSKGTANRTVTLTSAQRTALLNAMATVKSFTGTFALSSFSGSAQIGSTSSRTATVQTTAANSAPTLGGFTYEDSNTATKNITEDNRLFIQNHSVLKVTPGTATAKNGATITNYTASCNGLSVSNSTGAALSVGKITKSGNVMVTLTITDSRGYTSGVSKAVTVIPYSKPKVSSITLRRTNDIEAEMQLIFSGSISAVSVNGVQKNSVVYVRYRYKKTNDSSYGAFTSILGGTTRSGTSFSYSNLELCNLDANSSYDFHLQVQDKLYSASSLDLYFTVPQGTPLIALRKKKVGINTPNPQATLDIAGSVHINNSALADFVVQHGTNGIWTFRKWKSGIAECWCRKTVSATLNNNWGPLYTSGSLTALNIAFPFTFSAVPTITANLSCNGVGAFLMVPGSSPGPSTKSTGVYEIGRATSLSSANNFEVNFYVIGKV